MTRPGLARSIASNWTMVVFSALVGFFLSPFVVRSLGAVEFGVWTLLGALTGYVLLLDIGVRGAVTRYVARFMAQGDEQAASRYASIALRLYLGIGALGLAVVAVLAGFVNRWFDVPPALETSAQIVLILSGCAIVLTLIGGVFGGILVGFERFDLLNLSNIVAETLRVAAVVVVLLHGFGMVALAVIQVCTSAARLAAQMWIVRAFAPGAWPTLTHWDRREAGSLLSFSAAATMMQVAALLISYTDTIVIGALLPVALVTYFSIGAVLTMYARSIVGGLSQVMTPRASALDGAGAHEHLRATFLSVSRIATLAIGPIAATFLFRGESFISLWMGPDYGILSGDVLWVLTIPLLFVGGRQVAAATVIGMNLHRRLAAILIVEGVVNLALSILLVRPLGLVGVAVGTMIPSLAVSLGFVPWYLHRHLILPVGELMRDVWVRPLIAMVPFGVLSVLIERFWPASSLVVFFGQVALVLPVAALGAWVYGLSARDREELTLRVHRLRRGRRPGVAQGA